MKTRVSYKAQARSQRGIAIIELAIALPVMIVMLLVTAEATRVLYQYNTLTKLVRDGSRYMSAYTYDGVVTSGASDEEIQRVKRLVISGQPQGGEALLDGLGEDDISITLDSVGTGGTLRRYVQVSADYNYIPIFASIGGGGILPTIAPFDFTLTAMSSMRVQ